MSKSNKVTKAWSEAIGRAFSPELVEVEAADGRKQTQLVNPENGTIVLAVNKTGKEAEDALAENAGVPFLDAAFTELDVKGPNKGNQVDKADNSVPVPSDRPGAATEAEKSKNADKLAEDKG